MDDLFDLGGSRSCATGTPPTGPMGGSRSCATGNGIDQFRAMDAQERVPPGCIVSPERKHPSRNSVLVPRDNKSVILFVTVTVANRLPLLAHPEVVKCIFDAWNAAVNWLVGRYVIMPDHLHFFCAPGTWRIRDFHKWMAYWKSLSAKAFWKTEIGRDELLRVRSRGSATLPRNPPLWQRDCWDTQMRTAAGYKEKWNYVRNNPVRKGLVEDSDAWPYKGCINILEWRDE